MGHYPPSFEEQSQPPPQNFNPGRGQMYGVQGLWASRQALPPGMLSEQTFVSVVVYVENGVTVKCPMFSTELYMYLRILRDGPPSQSSTESRNAR